MADATEGRLTRMLTALIIVVLALCAFCALPLIAFAFSLVLRALPLFIGLMLCWWMFQACF